jgi:hypothetical protein
MEDERKPTVEIYNMLCDFFEINGFSPSEAVMICGNFIANICHMQKLTAEDFRRVLDALSKDYKAGIEK